MPVNRCFVCLFFHLTSIQILLCARQVARCWNRRVKRHGEWIKKPWSTRPFTQGQKEMSYQAMKRLGENLHALLVKETNLKRLWFQLCWNQYCDSNCITFEKSQNHGGSKKISSCQGLGRRAGWIDRGLSAPWNYSVWDHHEGHMFLCIYKTHRTYNTFYGSGS